MAHLNYFRKQGWIQLPKEGHLVFQVLWVFCLTFLILQKGLNLLQVLYRRPQCSVVILVCGISDGTRC